MRDLLIRLFSVVDKCAMNMWKVKWLNFSHDTMKCPRLINASEVEGFSSIVKHPGQALTQE